MKGFGKYFTSLTLARREKYFEAPSKIFWNHVWLEKKMGIEIIKLWVNSNKIIALIKANILAP